MPVLFNKKLGAPRDAIYIGRPSPWENPFVVGEDGTREECIKRFCDEILPDLDLEPLIGEDLVCWCWPKPCHGSSIMAEIERRHGPQE